MRVELRVESEESEEKEENDENEENEEYEEESVGRKRKRNAANLSLIADAAKEVGARSRSKTTLDMNMVSRTAGRYFEQFSTQMQSSYNEVKIVTKK